MPNTLWTVGHSTRPFDEFIDLLRTQAVQAVADVRRFPYSRRNPQYNADALQHNLPASGVQYHHLPGLGGRRTPRPDSPNVGWRNVSFRGYADYMLTPQFLDAIDELVGLAAVRPTAVMCAEAVPWRCHRSLLADALLVRGWTVFDIVSQSNVVPHTLPAWAQLEHGRLLYPGPKDDSTARLF